MEKMAAQNGEFYRSGSEFYARLDKVTKGLKLPTFLAVPYRKANFVQSSNANKSSDTDVRAFSAINCHKSVLFALRLVSEADLAEYSNFTVSLFDHEKYALMQDENAVRALITAACDKSPQGIAVVQIFDGEAVVHTFIAGHDEQRRVVCIEKIDFGKQFQIAPLSEIFARKTERWNTEKNTSDDLIFGEFEWAAGPIEEFMIGGREYDRLVAEIRRARREEADMREHGSGKGGSN